MIVYGFVWFFIFSLEFQNKSVYNHLSDIVKDSAWMERLYSWVDEQRSDKEARLRTESDLL